MIKLVVPESIDISDKLLMYPHRIAMGKEDRVPGQCPQCEQHALHLLWNTFYKRKASLWIWCSHCGVTEHATSQAPEWWQDIEDSRIIGELSVEQSRS